jgi:two-component system sensor histidine kinase GlrK
LRIAYPKSFLKLLLIGFALIILPLLFAFGNAALYLDNLADESRTTVTNSVLATRASRSMVEQLIMLERSARQYFVLHDGQLLENFNHSHVQFKRALAQLNVLPIAKTQQATLHDLTTKEAALYDEVITTQVDVIDTKKVIAEFVDLSTLAQHIVLENNQLIDQQALTLAKTTELTQKKLVSQALTLLPVALLVAIAITFLVAQPIRQMDAAIRRLGEGDYHEPINIDGPGDLHHLGEQLDWLRSQLEEVDQQKQRFLRHVSHELKTPLTAIREGSELFKDEIGGSLTPQQKEIAGIMQESSLRLQRMIENLLNYTAVQYHKPQLKLEKLELVELIKQILAEYALTLTSKNIVIRLDFSDTQMMGDHEKLHTVFDNLISNAIKYTPASGQIKISIKPHEDFAVFEIHDGGPGVIAADKARLFDPFYRGNGVYESLVSGSGLGLSIAKEYVDAHGGEITLLASEQGAHFRVRLPLSPESIKNGNIEAISA